LSPESRAELAKERNPAEDAFTAAVSACPPIAQAQRERLVAIRECQARAFYATAFYRSLRAQYSVTVTPTVIGGVSTEVVVPRGAIASNNRHRVLIDLHGGSFSGGARTNSQVESMPVASVGKVKVVSVDYRLAPESRYPAATEDVVAVYRELLKQYTARNIGIYGCSAGGALTAQTVAWLGTYDQLPKPLLYYQGIDLHDPLISPGDDDSIMRRFPPTLLISGTRDYLLSSVVSTHAQLVRLGVDADLHVWEGMQHAFFYYPKLPESQEAYQVIARFFDRHLGR
jgi:acetyl esterase/lipase